MTYHIAVDVSVQDMKTREMLGQEMFTIQGTGELVVWEIEYDLERAYRETIKQIRAKMAEREATG